MRLARFPFLLGLAALLPVTAGFACSSKSSSAPPGDDGGGATFTYTPQGCVYSYTAPSTLGFTDMAVDDTGPVDATNGVPQRVRVGLGGGTDKGQPGYADPSTSAAFTWETAESNHAAKLKLGTDPGALSDVHAGYAWTLPPVIGSTSIYMHEVHACGLKPGTTYFYQVGGGPAGQELWSATQSFTTVPASGKVTIGVLGDARDSKATWQAVHLRMRDAAVSMQLIGGDVVDVGAIEDLYTQWLGAIWKDPNDPSKFLTLGQQMIIPIAGNHENEAANFFANFAIPGSGDYAETYASFDVGSLHVALIDDQQIAIATQGAQAQAQLAWLDKDLTAANADRASHPFIVVIGHRGLYSTSLHSPDPDVLAARGALAPIFDKSNVDLVVNGHDHEYERSNPIKAGNPPAGAPVVGSGTTYVICAGAGADPYAVGTGTTPYSNKAVKFGTGTPYIGTYALLAVDAHTLTLTAYGLKASATTVAGDDVLDTVTLSH